MAHLEQRLLSGFAAAVFVGLSLITLRDANSIGWGWLLARGLVLVIMAASIALIRTRARWRLRPLRLIEAAVFVTLALYIAATTYAVGVADLGAGAAAWTKARCRASGC